MVKAELTPVTVGIILDDDFHRATGQSSHIPDAPFHGAAAGAIGGDHQLRTGGGIQQAHLDPTHRTAAQQEMNVVFHHRERGAGERAGRTVTTRGKPRIDELAAHSAHVLEINILVIDGRDRHRTTAESGARRDPRRVGAALKTGENFVIRRVAVGQGGAAIGPAFEECTSTAIADLVDARHAHRQAAIEQDRVLHITQHGGLHREGAGIGELVFHHRGRQCRIRRIERNENRVGTQLDVQRAGGIGVTHPRERITALEGNSREASLIEGFDRRHVIRDGPQHETLIEWKRLFVDRWAGIPNIDGSEIVSSIHAITVIAVTTAAGMRVIAGARPDAHAGWVSLVPDIPQPQAAVAAEIERAAGDAAHRHADVAELVRRLGEGRFAGFADAQRGQPSRINAFRRRRRAFRHDAAVERALSSVSESVGRATPHGGEGGTAETEFQETAAIERRG